MTLRDSRNGDGTASPRYQDRAEEVGRCRGAKEHLRDDVLSWSR